MTTRYEVVKARSAEEALKRCKFQAGELACIDQVEAVANGGGTYSCFPIVRPLSQTKVDVPDSAKVRNRELVFEKHGYSRIVDNMESKPQEELLSMPARSWRLLHAAIGIGTEGGEILDQMKRHLYYGLALDEVNIKEELGDTLWYVQLACNVLGLSMNEVIRANVRKLVKRYPDRFEAFRAEVRDLGAERAVLEERLPAESVIDWVEPDVSALDVGDIE